ncbi:hypothetical protein A2U01_0076590, partial [Trifolium medium]|nr:hypothetical protein [Trifolium medium]
MPAANNNKQNDLFKSNIPTSNDEVMNNPNSKKTSHFKTVNEPNVKQPPVKRHNKHQRLNFEPYIPTSKRAMTRIS